MARSWRIITVPVMMSTMGNKEKAEPSLCILSGEIGDTKTSAENFFSLPIYVIMGLAKSLPPRGRGTALAVEGACVTLSLD